jgi:hypothetical protein
VRGGHSDITDTLSDFEAEEIDEILSDVEMSEEMPVFSGDDKERQALIEYILGWRNEGAR